MTLFRRKPKWKKLAERAAVDALKLRAANYPFSLRLDYANGETQRQAGETWPDAYARFLGLSVPELRDAVRRFFVGGIPNMKRHSQQEIYTIFLGWASLLILIEQDLQACSSGQDLAPAETNRP